MIAPTVGLQFHPWCAYTALWSWPLWRSWSLFDWVCEQATGSNRCS